MRYKNLAYLLLIILLATVLRVYQLDKVPPALFGDEIDVGYQAYSILRTGQDIYSRTLPFYIKSLAEYRTPLYIYSAIPFVGIFGLNEWGTRLPAVFWGIVSILGLYFLVREVFNQKMALLAGVFLAISPWHIQYSRASFEVTMLLSFIIFGTYFFILGTKKKHFLVVAAVLFGLTPYIYSTAAVFTPIWILILTIVYLQKLRELFQHRTWVVLSLLVLLLTTLPALWSVYTGEARGRFEIISIFQESVLLDKLNLARVGQSYYTPSGELLTVSPTFERIFHNRPLVFTQVFTLNYLRAFSFDFLFAEGDPDFRQSIHEMGVLYVFEIFTILLGVWVLLTKRNNKEKIVISSWLLIAPIPAALTSDGGHHATRLILMLPPVLILSALGLYYILQNLNRRGFKIILGLLSVLIIANVVFYLHRYYIHYQIESWRWWHTGFRETMEYVNKNQDKYQKIVINNSYEPSLIRFLFYSQYDPAKFHAEFKGDQQKENILPGMDGFSLNSKFYFGRLSAKTQKEGGFESVLKPGMLYVASARDEASGDLRTYQHDHFDVLKTIVNPMGDPIFYILTGK